MRNGMVWVIALGLVLALGGCGQAPSSADVAHQITSEQQALQAVMRGVTQMKAQHRMPLSLWMQAARTKGLVEMCLKQAQAACRKGDTTDAAQFVRQADSMLHMLRANLTTPAK